MTTPYRSTALELEELHERLLQKADRLQRQLFEMELVEEYNGTPLDKQTYNRIKDRMHGYHHEAAQVRGSISVCYGYGTAAEGMG